MGGKEDSFSGNIFGDFYPLQFLPGGEGPALEEIKFVFIPGKLDIHRPPIGGFDLGKDLFGQSNERGLFQQVFKGETGAPLR